MSDRREAVEAMRGQPVKRIARETGVGETTVRRWLDPEFAQRMHEMSKAAKRRRRGTCEDCGGPTRYNGGTDAVSKVCEPCNRARMKAAKVWTREKIIDAIQRFAIANGRPPKSNEWIASDPVNDYPPRSNVYRSTTERTSIPFASWADAIEAAGFPRPLVGVHVCSDEVRARMSASQKRRWARQRGEVAA